MKSTIPQIVLRCVDNWSSFYDDPTLAGAAIMKHTQRVYTPDAEDKVSNALEDYFSRVASSKKKLLVSSITYDLPSVIDLALSRSGSSRRREASATPEIENAEGAVDYGELNSEEFEDLADPGIGVTDPND